MQVLMVRVHNNYVLLKFISIVKWTVIGWGLGAGREANIPTVYSSFLCHNFN